MANSIFPVTNKSTISENDFVMCFFTRDSVATLIVKAGQEMHNRHGVFDHSSMIGKRWGSKFYAKNQKGFCYLLRPTPELWTNILPHRTQILYHADISFITSYLDIGPGSLVIEAGTGSGSMSHSLARTIGPSGRLYSFEFHQERFVKAGEEFAQHGIDDRITLQHRNVCKDGFGLTNSVDSIFLDLPAPWEAVESAKEALKKDCLGKICCFSPCIEQVTRTVTALREAGFSNITMFETITTQFEPCGYVQAKIEDIIPYIHALERQKEEKREKQVNKTESNKGGLENSEISTSTSNAESSQTEEDDHNEGPAKKKVKTGTGKSESASVEPQQTSKEDEQEEEEDNGEDDGTSKPEVIKVRDVRPIKKGNLVSKPIPLKKNSIKQSDQTRGHTSYLTFAYLLPEPYRPASKQQTT